MADVYEERSEIASPGADIEDTTPQAASADDTPDVPSPDGPPEGLHFDFASDSAAPPKDAASERPTVPDAYLPVYNGETVRVDAADTERVTALLRQGMRFEQFEPQFETLRQLSLAAGYHRPEELIEQLSAALDASAFEQLLQESGGNRELAAEVMEARRHAVQTALNSEKPLTDAERTARLHDRLAREYRELSELCPDIPAFGDLPTEVVQSAVRDDASLTDTYLRFEQRQRLLRQQEEQAARDAHDASTGSLYAGADEAPSDASRSFVAGFRNRL